MKNLIIGIVIGALLGTTITVLADSPTNFFSAEQIFNRVWNTSNNSLYIKGV